MLFALLLAACQSATEPDHVVRTEVALGQAGGTQLAPKRAIAIVLDGSSNMGPRCDYDLDSPPWAPLTICKPFDGFDRQRDGAIKAIRTMVPLGGSVAITVLLSANRREGNQYLGPQVVVPYTVIRTEDDRTRVIVALQQMQIATDHPMQVDHAFGGCTEWRFDSHSGICYSGANPGWAVHEAKNVLDNATSCGQIDAGADCPSPPKKEICLAGALRVADPPIAYWDWHQTTQIDHVGAPQEPPFPPEVPDEAKVTLPAESALNVDRFTAIDYSLGITSPLYDDLPQADLDEQAGRDHGWGALIHFEGTVAADRAGEVRIILGEVAWNAVAQPAEASPPQAPLVVPITGGMTAEQASSAVATAMTARLWQNPYNFPVVPQQSGKDVLLLAHSAYDSSTSGDRWLPFVAIQSTLDQSGLTVTFTGGSHREPTRAFEEEQISARWYYDGLVQGRGALIFPSGFMFKDQGIPASPAAQQGDPYDGLPTRETRTRDYAKAIKTCFGSPFKLRGIEVNQVIQDWHQSVPLIERKPTVVRAFLETADKTRPLADVRLYGYAPLPGSNADCSKEPSACVQLDPVNPLAPCLSRESCSLPGAMGSYQPVVNAPTERDKVDAAQLFPLPEHWLQGELYLQVDEVGGFLDCQEPADGDAAGPGAKDCWTHVRFTKHGADTASTGDDGELRTTVLRIAYYKAGQQYLPDEAETEASQKFIDLFLPVASVVRNPDRELHVNSFEAFLSTNPKKMRPTAGSPGDPLGIDTPGKAQAEAYQYRILLTSTFFVKAYECRASCPIGVAQGVYWASDNAPSSFEPVFTGMSADGCGVSTYMSRYSSAHHSVPEVTSAHEFAHALGRRHTLNGPTGPTGAPDVSCDARDSFSEPHPWVGHKGEPNFPFPSDAPLIGPVNFQAKGGDDEVWGWWPAKGLPVDPYTNYELMSYCLGSGVADRWISKIDYQRLLSRQTISNPVQTPDPSSTVKVGGNIERFVESPGLLVQPDCASNWPTREDPRPATCRQLLPLDCGGSAVQAPSEPATWIRGVFYGIAPLDAEFFHPINVSHPLSPPVSSLLNIRLQDASGATVGVVPIDYFEHSAEGGNDTGTTVFSAFVPADPTVTRMSVEEGGVELTSITASPSAPTIHIMSPVEGAIFSAPSAQWAWTGIDSDGDALNYFVEYSPDGGNNWLVQGIDYDRSDLSLNLDAIPGSENAFLRVTVSDGFHSTTDTAGPFTVRRKAPSVRIHGPDAGERVSDDQTVFFDATAVDAEDGPIANSQMVWTSDRDGEIGVGRLSRRGSSLSEGIHNITASVTDTDGLVGTAETTIEVVGSSTTPFVGPRLLLAKVHEGDFEIGTTGRYLLTLQNVGTQPTATDLTLTDTLPDALEYVGAAGPDWSCDFDGSHVVTCVYHGGPLVVGASAPSIAVDVDPQASGVTAGATSFAVTNTAHASFAGALPEAESDAADSTLVTIPAPPVLAAQGVGPSVIRTGVPTKYTLMVTNGGDSHAHELAVDMSVAAGATITAAIGTNWSCSLAGRTAHCDYNVDTVAPGEVLPTIEVTVVVQDPTLASIDLSYQVSAKGGTQVVVDGGASDAGDAGAEQVAVEVTGQALPSRVQEVRASGPDLLVDIYDPCMEVPDWLRSSCTVAHFIPAQHEYVGGDAARVQGGSWSHALRVWNLGSTPASSPIRLVDVLPPGTQATNLDDQLARNWLCDGGSDGRTVTCDYVGSPLQPLSSSLLYIYYSIAEDAPKELTNTVSVATEDEVVPQDNVASHTVTLVDRPCALRSSDGVCLDNVQALPPTSLGAALTVTNPLVVGQPGQATFTVKNFGATSVHKNDVVLDALGDPSLLLVDSYSGTGWSCSLNWGKATCSYVDPSNGNLGPSQSLPVLTVHFTVGPHPYALMRIPAEVGTATTLGNRTFITASVQQTVPLVGPTQGTLALSGCPLGADCNLGKTQYPTKFPQGRRGIQLLDLQTLSTRTLASSGEEPAWSPDGVFLSFNALNRDCSPSPTDFDCVGGIEISYVDTVYAPGWTSQGEDIFWLTDLTEQARFGSWSHGVLLYSDAEPCGSCNNTDYPDPRYGTRVAYNLRTIREPDRAVLDRLFFDHYYESSLVAYEANAVTYVYPAWSPVGNTLAYGYGTPSKVWLAEEGSSTLTNKRRLTAAAGSVKEGPASWSRDGTKVAFSSNVLARAVAEGTGAVFAHGA